MRFASKVVVASVTAVVLFTLGMFAIVIYNIDHMTNVQVPTELVVSWYAFWTVELVSLASIRKEKVKNKYEREEGDDDGQQCE